MTEPSVLSQLGGIAFVLAVVAICGLTIEWLRERGW